MKLGQLLAKARSYHLAPFYTCSAPIFSLQSAWLNLPDHVLARMTDGLDTFTSLTQATAC